jgi:hypothetical protein
MQFVFYMYVVGDSKCNYHETWKWDHMFVCVCVFFLGGVGGSGEAVLCLCTSTALLFMYVGNSNFWLC